MSASVSARSLREGLCSSTPSRLAEWPKENAHSSVARQAIFVEMENKMDHLLQCAKNFERLTHFQYRIIIGRKRRTVELKISFSVTDFHHLAGLHNWWIFLKLMRESVKYSFEKFIRGD